MYRRSLSAKNGHTAVAFEIVNRECARLGIRLPPGSPHAFDAGKLAREEREFAAADALLCPSEFVAATHASRGEHDSRLLRHRYGYDPAQFFLPSEPGRTGDPLVFVFLGRLEPRKGVHLALEAWRRSGIGAKARLLLYGEMEQGYERVLAPLIDQPGVELLGPIGNPGAILRESDDERCPVSKRAARLLPTRLAPVVPCS